jgi:speckle-type POZ protein
MSAALSALRAAGRPHLSASKFVSRQATGSHVFQIDTYAQARRTIAMGEKIRSEKFSVGGHDWRVECYPNGFPGYDGFISLYVNHASHAKTGDTTAKFGFSILDRSCWKPSCTKFSDEPHGFTSTVISWGWGKFIKHEDLDKEKHLKDDCLSILCDVSVTGLRADDHTEVAEQEPEPALLVPASPPFDLHGPIGEVTWNKQKPDLKIEAGGETFAVHRWVLEARSPVFKADLSLASAGSEGAAELRIDNMNADVCKALLRFIYDEIPGSDFLETDGMAKRLLIAADRYKLEKLKRICEMALLPSIRTSSVAATLALAEQHRCADLKSACIKFLSSPGNLKKALAERHHGPELRKACMRFLPSRDNIVALAETDGFARR